MPVRHRVHPAIGSARVGDSRDEFVIGAQAPRVAPTLTKPGDTSAPRGYKNAQRRIKRHVSVHADPSGEFKPELSAGAGVAAFQFFGWAVTLDDNHQNCFLLSADIKDISKLINSRGTFGLKPASTGRTSESWKRTYSRSSKISSSRRSGSTRKPTRCRRGTSPRFGASVFRFTRTTMRIRTRRRVQTC